MSHTVVTAAAGGLHVAGCTCGWVGPRRSLLQAAIADKLTHQRDTRARVLPCAEPGCPIEACR